MLAKQLAIFEQAKSLSNGPCAETVRVLTMLLPMTVVGMLIGKYGPAQPTMKFDALVLVHVNFEVGVIVEPLNTLVTTEAEFSCVKLHVKIQRRSARVHLAAN